MKTKTNSTLYITILLCILFNVIAISEEYIHSPADGWSTTYRTSRGSLGLRMMPYKALKFRAEEAQSIAALKSAISEFNAIKAILQTTAHMDANGILLIELEDDKSISDLRSEFTGSTSPQFIGDVFSPFPEADDSISLQSMSTPYIYVSCSAASGSETISMISSAYGASIIEEHDYSAIGLKGYLLRFQEDDDLFAIAEIIAFHPDVRAAAPEFLQFHDYSSSFQCPSNPLGCQCGEGEAYPEDEDLCYDLAGGLDISLTSDPLCTPYAEACYRRGADRYYPRRQAYLLLTNVPEAWEKTTGDPSVKVAVIDTGVGPHLDYKNVNEFDGVLLPGYDSVYGQSDSYDLNPNSHGTKSAGIIAARRNNGAGIAGIAGGNGSGEYNGCRIIPIRGTVSVLNGDVTSYALRVADAILFAVQNDANVITMSLGCHSSSEALICAIEEAYAKGIILVAAAHNHDIAHPTYPALYPEVIAVGSLTYSPNANFSDIFMGDTTWKADDIGMHRLFGRQTGLDTYTMECAGAGADPTGGNFGPALDIAAPAVLIHSTTSISNSDWLAAKSSDIEASSACGRPCYTGYGTMVATSSAAPQVAAAAALILSRDKALCDVNPERIPLDPLEAIAMLKASAKDLYYIREEEIAGPGRDIYTGYGLLDTAAAVSLVEAHRFIIRNRNGEFIASFFAGSALPPVTTFPYAYGIIDYGNDGGGDDAVPDSSAGGDVEGNAANGILVIRGAVYEQVLDVSLAPTDSGDFIVRSEEGEPVLRIDDNGNMFLKGRVHQYPWAPEGLSAFPAPGENACFALKTENELTFAFVTDGGHLYLRGALFESAAPDKHYGEKLVWHEDFQAEYENNPESNPWVMQGNWTNERYMEYAVCMAAASVSPEECDLSGATSHMSVAFAELYIDSVNENMSAVFGARTRDRMLREVRLYQPEVDCLQPYRTFLPLSEEQPIGSLVYTLDNLNESDYQNLLTWKWYFEAKDSPENYLGSYNIMGGIANGYMFDKPDWGLRNAPNKFLTLNSQGQGDYIERDVALQAHNGFVINFQYQIAEDGTQTEKTDNPGIRLELYEENAAQPSIDVAVYHYLFTDEYKNVHENTCLQLRVDYDGDGLFSTGDPETTFVDDARSTRYSAFEPILRRMGWYEVMLLGKRDDSTGQFRLRAMTRRKMVEPWYWDTGWSPPIPEAYVPKPTHIRMRRLNTYNASTNLRIDDITVICNTR